MSSLEAARQDRVAGGPFAHGSRVNELPGWRIHGRSGVLPLVDVPAGRILRAILFEQLWRGAAAKNGRARSRATSESRAKQREKSQDQRAVTAKYSGRNRGFPRPRAMFP